MSKVFKVWIHQSNFSEEDIVVNPKDFQNGIKEGDIIQIYQVFEDSSSTCKLLLQIKSLQTDFQQKETISIKHSVANKFKFRAYWDVHVLKVTEPKHFRLNLVELKFKDQYLSRSDMWRFGQTLVNSSVYTSKKLSFAGARAEVYEMWATGEMSKKVICGVVGEDTRVVFRSGSASVFIFLQMSKEMWDFDINGDLYFEKTINGFLMELFTKWKEMKCNHAVTIVYFSRIFYDKSVLNTIPDEVLTRLRCDYKGRHYEDIYRAIVHQERRDDWSTVLVTLKKHFTRYCKSFNQECSLSTASEGNFLEVMNLGVNVLEKAHIDRNLEGTGPQLVVVTPGAGMFEVDRELAMLTKRKIVDNGLSADLVCMAEQPLHSVPLLKLHGSTHSDALIGDDYSIPHWINHSFYTSKTQLNQRNVFIPRINVPDFILQSHGLEDNRKLQTFFNGDHSEEIENSKLPDFVDYDAYDAEVFTCVQTKPRPQTVTPGYNPYVPLRESRKATVTKDFQEFLENENMAPSKPILKSKSSAVLINKKRDSLDEGAAGSLRMVKSLGTMLHFGNDIIDGNFSSPEQQCLASTRAVVGSADTSQVYHNVGRPQRALLNPFRPNYLACKMTCNRHRWKHVFPKGPGGEMLQEHHHRISESVDDHDLLLSLYPGSVKDEKLSGVNLSHMGDDVDGNHGDSDDDSTSDVTVTSPPTRPISGQHGSVSSRQFTPVNIKNLGWLMKLHAPSEEDWTAAVKTSVDWKSLTIPACLPVTTDYFPDPRILNNLYKIHNYVLFIGEEDEEENPDSNGTENRGEEVEIVMKPDKIFKELISQRIGQGFQLISPDANLLHKTPSHFSPVSHSRRSFGVIPKGEPDKDYNFMMGRYFHRITAPCSGQVSITRYHPSHVIKFNPVTYTYQLWSESRQEYVTMTTPFKYDDLTNYNWNYLDQYVARDEESLNLIDSLNYWRVRLVLLPLKKPRDKLSISSDCEEEENSIQHTYLEGILRFLETVNKIKRPPASRYQAKKGPSSRRVSTPCAPTHSSKNTASRTHRRSRSGDGVKDLKVVIEDPTPSEVTNNSPSPEKSRPSTPSRYRSLSSDHDGNEDNPPSLQDLFKAMNMKETGVGILPEIRGLPPGTFLGTDATSWLMKYAKLKYRPEAVKLGQKMLDAGYIQHASRSLVQTFVDGFYLYYMVKSADRREVIIPDVSDPYKYRIWKITQDEFLSKFQFKWFEVVMREIRSEETKLPFDIFIENQDEAGVGRPDSKLIPIYRDAEINLGQSGISDRSEWCTVRYHGFFCPDNAYEVHLRWMISTGSVINELVQSWARKVTLYGFHLVPVPTFLLDGKRARNDPFTEPHFIPLEETSFKQHVEKQDFDQKEYKVRIYLLLESILKRFGFIKDFPYDEGIYKSYQRNKKTYPFRYIHYTGAVFVTLVDHEEGCGSYGYVWMLNDMITKRWKSPVTLDNEAVQNLLRDLRDFCGNKNDKLDAYISLISQKTGVIKEKDEHVFE